MVLKPSEKVPFSAIPVRRHPVRGRLPPEMLSVVTGDPREIADEMLTNEHVDLITFTGGVAIGKYIAEEAGYRRVVLELGGNDPIIVMEDADIDGARPWRWGGSLRTPASAARPSSACWCTRRWPTASSSRWWPRRAPGPTATRRPPPTWAR